MTTLHGGAVMLRPFRPEEIEPALDRIFGIEAEPDEGEESPRALRRKRLALSGTRTRWELLFAIEAEDRLVGEIQARSSEEAMPPGVFEIGIEVYGREDRRRGFGSGAIDVLTSHLFEREEAIRVQASTELDNAAMRRTLERLGFGYEGVLRGFMPSPEGPRDYAMYAVTKADWTERRSA